MDLAAARRDGIDLFTHKLTEGSTWRAVHAQTALSRARAAGVPFLGGYHVVRSGTSSAAQVANLLNFADAIVPWWRAYPGWFWQVDLELWPYDNVSAAKGREFTDALRGAQPKTVVMYASRGQYGDSLSGLNVELWNANYGANPTGHYRELYPGDGSARWTAYSGKTPKILQYGARLTIGSQPTCDANAYRGSFDELRALITGGIMAAYDETDPVFGNGKENAYSVYHLLLDLFAMEVRPGGVYWQGKLSPVDPTLIDTLKRIDTNAAKAATGQAAVTLSDADRTAITQALIAAVPDALAELIPRIAEAVLDEQHRRDEA
jgi:hypothetical protein